MMTGIDNSICNDIKREIRLSLQEFSQALNLGLDFIWYEFNSMLTQLRLFNARNN